MRETPILQRPMGLRLLLVLLFQERKEIYVTYLQSIG